MKATVLAVTKDLENENKELGYLEENKTFSGKMAGICYQKDKYFGTSVSDPDKALKRFKTIISTGHHSIADHTYVTILFEDISKMLAMLLNSMNCYNTSEKSGRYTVMTGNSDKEQELYNKWKDIFRERILELYPDYDDAMLQKKLDKELEARGSEFKLTVKNGKVLEDFSCSFLNDIKSTDSTLPSIKLAQENARYILSVYTYSVTLSYSTTLRQWNYIYDWCQDAIAKCEERTEDFYKKLSEDLHFLADTIHENLYVEELRDNKNRYFYFLIDLYKYRSPLAKYEKDRLGFTYNTSYESSFVSLAQAQRHRTLRYYMNFNPSDTLNFYIPEMIRGIDLEKEWLNDLNSVAEFYPQATKVKVIEAGLLPDFVLKCKERLCGRAQLETMRQTVITAGKFIEASDGLTDAECMYIDEFKYSGEVATKCLMIAECKEPCYWGRHNALDRNV